MELKVDKKQLEKEKKDRKKAIQTGKVVRKDSDSVKK